MWTLYTPIILFGCAIVCENAAQMTPRSEATCAYVYHISQSEGAGESRINANWNDEIILALENLKKRMTTLENQKNEEKQTLRLAQDLVANPNIQDLISGLMPSFVELVVNQTQQTERQNLEIAVLKERSSMLLDTVRMMRMNSTQLYEDRNEISKLKLELERCKSQQLEQQLESRNLRDAIKTLQEQQSAQESRLAQLNQTVDSLSARTVQQDADIQSLRSSENSTRIQTAKRQSEFLQEILNLQSTINLTQARITNLQKPGYICMVFSMIFAKFAVA